MTKTIKFEGFIYDEELGGKCIEEVINLRIIENQINIDNIISINFHEGFIDIWYWIYE